MITTRLSFQKILALGVLVLAAITCFKPAFALDTTLDAMIIDQGEKGSSRFSKIEIIGANLTEDELRKLFSTATTPPERTALIARLKADKIVIPEILAIDKTSKVTVSNLLATGITEGKIAKASLEAINGTFTPEQGGQGTIQSGVIVLEGADFTSILGLSNGNLAVGKVSIEAIAFTFPDKDTPETAIGGNRMTLKLGALVAEATFDGSIMTKGMVNLKGFTVQAPPASAFSQQLALAGYDRLELGLTYASTYDAATRVLSLEDLTLTGAGAGTLHLKTRFGGVDKSIFTSSNEEKIAALLQSYIGTVVIHYADTGLVSKTLGLLAQQQQKTPDALRAETATMIRQLVPFLLGGTPKAPKISETIANFIEKPTSLGVTLHPKGGIAAILDLAQIVDPQAFFSKVEMDVEAGAASAALPEMPPVPAAKPAVSQKDPAPTAPSKRRTGLDAWTALVGNTILGKDSEGNALVEFYRKDGTVKQLIDEEAATGNWSFKNGKVCFEFPNDDDEICYKIALDGNIATFTDDDGVSLSYDVVSGNPKKL